MCTSPILGVVTLKVANVRRVKVSPRFNGYDFVSFMKPFHLYRMG